MLRFYFTYEKIQGIILRDFRQQLEHKLKELYSDKKIKEIPEEFEIKLKYNIIYKIFFLNREYLLEEAKDLKYEPKLLKWVMDCDEF